MASQKLKNQFNSVVLTKTLSEVSLKENKILTIIGSGIDFRAFNVCYEGVSVHKGLILVTDKGDPIRVLETFEIEDFYDNIKVALCELITNIPTDPIDKSATLMRWSYTASKPWITKNC